MISNKKAIWLIVVIIAALSVVIALKTSNADKETDSIRGVLVKRIDYYGC